MFLKQGETLKQSETLKQTETRGVLSPGLGKFRIPNSEFEDTPLLTRGLLHFGIRIWACSVFFRASRVRGNIGNIGNTANNANNANIANRWDKWDKWDIWNEWNNLCRPEKS